MEEAITRLLQLAAAGLLGIGLISCSAERGPLSPQPSRSQPQPTAGATDAVQETPAPRELETRLINALANLEIAAMPTEHSFRSASVWAEVDSPHPLFVHAYDLDVVDGDYVLVHERMVAGIRVETVQYRSGPVRDRFECKGVAYEAEGAAPARFASFDEFLAALIEGLECVEDAAS